MVTPLSELTEQERAQAVERFNVLRPFLGEDVSLLQIAHQQQVSLRTLRRWIHCYHIEGLPGLIRKCRADRGERRRLLVFLGRRWELPAMSLACGLQERVCEPEGEARTPAHG